MSQAWKYTSRIVALESEGGGICPGLHSKCQVSQCYRARPYLKEQNKQKTQKKLISLIQALMRQRKADLCKFGARQVYIVSSRTKQ